MAPLLLLPPCTTFPVTASERGSSTSGTTCNSAEPPLALMRKAFSPLAGRRVEQGEDAGGHNALITRAAAEADGQAAMKGLERPAGRGGRGEKVLRGALT